MRDHLRTKLAGKWVYGGLAQNIWGVAGSDRNDVNYFLTQIFVNYDLSAGWFLTSAPIITAAESPDIGPEWELRIQVAFLFPK